MPLTNNDTDEPDETDADLDYIQQAVREIMQRNGIADRQQSIKLSEILDLSYSQVRRIIVTGDWTVRQLSTVAAYFGVSLRSLFNGFGAVSLDDEGLMHDGVLDVGAGELPCRVRLGDPLYHLPKDVDFVAVEVHDNLRVVKATAIPENAIPFRVEKLEISIKQPYAPSIAIVDDERPSADSLRDFLNESGFKASSFYDSAAALRETQESAFDGYVIDWVLGETTAESLIKQIRNSSTKAPIILLTGEYQSGKANEDDVARVMRLYDLTYQEKPSRPKVIVAELSKVLGC